MKRIILVILTTMFLIVGCVPSAAPSTPDQTRAQHAPPTHTPAAGIVGTPREQPAQPTAPMDSTSTTTDITDGSGAQPTLPPAEIDETALAADITIRVDGAQQFQQIDGFGVNANSAAWRDGQITPALDLLTNTMGARIWRVIVESHENWETANDNNDPMSFNWDYYNQLYETPKFQALWGLLGYLQQKPGDIIYLNVMGCVPEWMGRCSINSDAEDEWVEMIASLLVYARDTKHLRIDIISPMNEQDLGGPEGPKVDSEQYVGLMNKLSARLDGLAVGDIQLIGPDTAYVDQTADSYLPAMLGDAALMQKVRHFAAHNYDGQTGAIDETIKSSDHPNRNFWMTEFSAWCQGCDTGSQPSDAWGFATQTVDHLLGMLNQGAAGALVYDAYDSFYEHHGSMGYWGLVGFDSQTQTYTPRKRFYTLAQVFKFVAPGMRRIAVTPNGGDISLVAFADSTSGNITIVGHNASDRALTQAGTLDNLSAVKQLSLYQTTQSANLARGPDVPISNQIFSAQIEPESIFTLTTQH
jgi:O-glycosyl hydrolase